MDERIIDPVNDFPAWKGDTYRLAALVAEQQKQAAAELLEEAGMPEAADIVRS